MKQTGYITVQEWMLGLGLKGSELLIYALIWSFSRDGVSWFQGTAAFVAHWCGVSDRQVKEILKKLHSRGLIERRDHASDGAVIHREYRAAGIAEDERTPGKDIIPQDTRETLSGLVSDINGGRNFTREGKNFTLKGRNFTREGSFGLCEGEETSPNNNRDNYPKENKEIYKEKKERVTEFPYPSAEFSAAWKELCRQPKWRNKSQDALRIALRRLSRARDERIALRMIENTIAGGWQGLFELKPEELRALQREGATGTGLTPAQESIALCKQGFEKYLEAFPEERKNMPPTFFVPLPGEEQAKEDADEQENAGRIER